LKQAHRSGGLVKELPNDSLCYVCGNANDKGLQRNFYIDGKVVTARFQGEDYHKGHGSIHGGIAAALLDEAMGLAATKIKNTLCVTAEITVRYIRPLEVNNVYVVRGHMIADKKLLCETYGDIVDSDNNIFVKAYGKYVPVPKEDSREMYPNVFKDNCKEGK